MNFDITVSFTCSGGIKKNHSVKRNKQNRKYRSKTRREKEKDAEWDMLGKILILLLYIF